MTPEYEKARDKAGDEYAEPEGSRAYDGFIAGADFSREWHLEKLEVVKAAIENGTDCTHYYDGKCGKCDALKILESLGVR